MLIPRAPVPIERCSEFQLVTVHILTVCYSIETARLEDSDLIEELLANLLIPSSHTTYRDKITFITLEYKQMFLGREVRHSHVYYSEM